jgi:hypothetical protein
MESEKKISEMIEALEHGGGLVLKGCLFEELQDAVVIKTGGSLFEIPRKYIHSMKEVKETEGAKIVEVCIASDAKLIQSSLVTVPSLRGRGGDGGGGGACACACQCNCACDCACSQLEFTPMAKQGFRNRMGAAQS